MGGLEVLVATMNQKDLRKIQEMNIQSDVFFANQAAEYAYQEKEFGKGYKARMLTTPERGVGKNRNKALLYAEGEILLFSDDDMKYYDGYAEKVISAYKELPEADVIIFSFHLTKKGKVCQTIQNKTKRLSLFRSMRYGTCVLSIKKESWLKANIYFSSLFGGGAPYSAGEDSLFIRECFKKKLRIYSHEYILGESSQDSSTWFEGYTKKFFYDKGMLYAALFPKVPRLMCIQFIVRHHEMVGKEMIFSEAIKYMFEGVQYWEKGKA